MKIETIIGIMVLFVLCIGSSSAQGQRNPTEMAEMAYKQAWAKVLESFRKMVYDFEVRCEAKNKRFDSLKMEEELEECIGDELKNLINPTMTNPLQAREVELAFINVKSGRRLRPDQVTLIQDSVVKPSCTFLHEYTQCLKPHRNYLIDLCTEGSGMESRAQKYADILTASLCKENGKEILDFIEADGMSCSNDFVIGAGGCLLNFTDEESLAAKPNTTLELCNKLEILHDCLDSGMDTCPKKKPVEIMRSMFKEAKTWVKTSCMKDSGESIQHFPFFLYILISFLAYFGLRV